MLSGRTATLSFGRIATSSAGLLSPRGFTLDCVAAKSCLPTTPEAPLILLIRRDGGAPLPGAGSTVITPSKVCSMEATTCVVCILSSTVANMTASYFLISEMNWSTNLYTFSEVLVISIGEMMSKAILSRRSLLPERMSLSECDNAARFSRSLLALPPSPATHTTSLLTSSPTPFASFMTSATPDLVTKTQHSEAVAELIKS